MALKSHSEEKNMLKEKRILFSSLFLIAFLTPTALDQYSAQNSIGTVADGTAPPAPPIPYGQTLGNETILQADGTAPPPPPIPWKYSAIDVRS
jgi:hypothetical protein